MAKNNKIVRKWRGTRELYNFIKNANALDYWTRYSVKEVDGTWTEYYGSNMITSNGGQILPVLDIVENLPSILNPGDRYLVGIDANEESKNAEYYIVIIDPDSYSENGLSHRTEPFLNNSGMSVRVINRKSMAYQLVDGKLITYDEVDGGTF